MGRLDIPQSITLVTYIQDFLLIDQYEQEVMRALEGFIGYKLSRGGKRTP